MIQVLKENRPESFLPFLRHALIENKQLCVLETLDQGKGGREVCSKPHPHQHYVITVAQEVSDPLIVCRVYASIADMLGYMAGEAGIRAGPAANINWRSAFALLEVSQVTHCSGGLEEDKQFLTHTLACRRESLSLPLRP